MELREKALSADYKFNGRIINLRVDQALLPNGKVAGREVVEHPGGVAVLPLTDEGEVLLVRQFRYPYGEILTEIPAGKREPGEDPMTTGVRELAEETGAVADRVVSLGVLYPTPGYCNEVIHLYLATGLHFAETDPDEDEFLSIEKMPLEALVDEVLAGNVPDAKTQVAVLKAWHYLNNPTEE